MTETKTRRIEQKSRKATEKLNQRLERLTVEHVAPDSLKPNDFNTNRQSEHDFELLVKSIEEDGFTQPILAQAETREIIDGEHRWRAARHLGMTEVPVVFTTMSATQMRLAMVRHNRARGSEDIELFAQLLRDLEQVGDLDWAQDSLLMDDVEIQRLIEDVAAPEALAAEEFSQAWIPQGTKVSGDTTSHDGYIGGAQSVEGASQLASDRLRQTEKRIAEAKTEEERQSAMRDRDVHRVALTFAGDEAAIVRKALGDRPADKLLELCRKELGTEG